MLGEVESWVNSLCDTNGYRESCSELGPVRGRTKGPLGESVKCLSMRLIGFESPEVEVGD